MHVKEHTTGDLARLHLFAKRERDSARRDRLRAVLLALGGHEAEEIAGMLGRSRRQVQVWVYAHRDGGIERIHPPRRTGRKRWLGPDEERAFAARFAAGPRPEDGVCTPRGKDTVRILEQEFGKRYSLQGAYDLLHRLGLSCLRPRPRHENQDLKRQGEFRERAPLLSGA